MELQLQHKVTVRKVVVGVQGLHFTKVTLTPAASIENPPPPVVIVAFYLLLYQSIRLLSLSTYVISSAKEFQGQGTLRLRNAKAKEC